MPAIEFRGGSYPASGAETVLEALQRHGVEVPFSCKKGTCHSCVLRHLGGQPPPAEALPTLGETSRALGYFLPCAFTPTEDIRIADPGEELLSRATVVDRTLLAKGVLRLRLAPVKPFAYRAGQYVNVRRPDGVTRAYSLASVPGADAHLELHVRRRRNGVLSSWLFDTLAVGDPLDLFGPSGTTFYAPGRPEQPLLLVATGTGLAPLYGVVRDALRRGHAGPIALYHGAFREDGVYLEDELRALTAAHPQLRHATCGEEVAYVALQAHPDLSRWRVFLCGSSELVHAARRAAYLAGASLADILGDAFDLRDLRRRGR